MTKHRFGLTELSASPEIHGEIVENIHAGLVHGAFAKAGERAVEIASRLISKSKHAVSSWIGRLTVRRTLDEALADQKDMAEHEYSERLHELQPHGAAG